MDAAVPRVRIGEWFNEAWELVRTAWLEYVLTLVVYSLVMTITGILCAPAVLFIGGPFTGGVYVYIAKRMLNQPAEVSDILKGFRRYGPTTLLFLVIALVPIIGLILLVVMFLLPALGGGHSVVSSFLGALSCIGCCLIFALLLVYPVIVGTFLIFAYPLVLFRDMSVADAIRMSIDLVRPQWSNFLMLLLAQTIILVAASSVGAALFMVGYLILQPLATAIVMAMHLLAYRDFVGLTVDDLAPYA